MNSQTNDPTRRSFIGAICGGATALAMAPLIKTAKSIKKELVLPEETISLIEDTPLIVTNASMLDAAAVKQSNPRLDSIFYGADYKQVARLGPVDYVGFVQAHRKVNERFGVSKPDDFIHIDGLPEQRTADSRLYGDLIDGIPDQIANSMAYDNLLHRVKDSYGNEYKGT